MAHNYERTKEKLERTEARMLKVQEEEKRLEAELKELRAREERERLISRGEMLEKVLRDPLTLSNEQIDSLLTALFGMPDAQRLLSTVLGAATDGASEAEVSAVDDAASESEDTLMSDTEGQLTFA